MSLTDSNLIILLVAFALVTILIGSTLGSDEPPEDGPHVD